MISPVEIEKIFLDVLFTKEEIGPDKKPSVPFIAIKGLTANYGLHPERLEKHRQEVLNLIEQLPTNFLTKAEGGGDGWSFLELCADKGGVQWGEHRNCEELLVLAMGLKLADYCLPRDMWDVLPGGLPYVVFTKVGFTQ